MIPSRWIITTWDSHFREGFYETDSDATNRFFAQGDGSFGEWESNFFNGLSTAVTELEARVAADPGDHEALFQLALRKVVEQDYETAMELLLQLMQKDRSFGDDAGRRGLLKVFELLGDDPRVNRYRSRMASLSY